MPLSSLLGAGSLLLGGDTNNNTNSLSSSNTLNNSSNNPINVLFGESAVFGGAPIGGVTSTTSAVATAQTVPVAAQSVLTPFSTGLPTSTPNVLPAPVSGGISPLVIYAGVAAVVGYAFIQFRGK